MRDGAGPLLTVFLIRYASLDPSGLSWVMAMPGIAALLLQIPLGFLYDRVADRRRLLALGASVMIAAGFLLSRVPGFYGLLVAQALVGVAMSMLSVGVPALSLQTCRAEGFGPRLARNEVFSKIGNFSALGLTGFLTQSYGLHWMFAVIYAFAGGVILVSLAMPKPAPTEPAPPAAPRSAAAPAPRLWRAVATPAFLRLVALTGLYFFANSAMLFVFEQAFVPGHPNGGAGLISSALGVSQVMVFVGSIYLARKTKLLDAEAYLGFGFFLIVARGFLFAADLEIYSLFPGEFLDGIIAAIVIIVPARAMAAMGEQNFNIRSGLLGTAASLGASASTVSAGYLIQHVGHGYTFIALAAAGAIGLGAVYLGKLLAPRFTPAAEWGGGRRHKNE